MLITEDGLDAFRRERLSPHALLELIEKFVWVLIKLGIGVGKSFAVDALLGFPKLFRRFDLVIYAAPTWSIIRERAILSGRARSPAAWLVIEPRPRKRCGKRARRWLELEAQGCAALAKEELCGDCTATDEHDNPCPWPDQLRKIRGIGLVFCTEKQFLQNRSLMLMLRARTRAKRVLVILDEGRLVDAHFEVAISRAHLRVFHSLLTILAAEYADLARNAQDWLAWTGELLGATNGTIEREAPELDDIFLRSAAEVQAVGVERFGSDFRYLGYELMQLRWSRPEERSIDHNGTIRFTARPFLNAHLLVLSAHVHGDYVAHRLGADRVASPFGDVVVQHSGTRIFNLRSRIGADKYFPGNRKQILDTIAVLVWLNIQRGTTTLLISRKKSKRSAAEYLEERLAGWGARVRFILDGSSPPVPPDPCVVPFIHYGVLGVNDYTEYESAFCVNAYYLSSRVVSNRVQEFDARIDAVDLRIASGVHRQRRVEVAAAGDEDLGRSTLGNLYLRRLEVDPVVQAAGRVRFLTKPRTVLFFQMGDLAHDVGPCTDVTSLEALRAAMAIPSAKEVDHAFDGERLRALVDGGASIEDAAAELGMSRATAFRRLGASLRSPQELTLGSWRGIETRGGGA